MSPAPRPTATVGRRLLLATGGAAVLAGCDLLATGPSQPGGAGRRSTEGGAAEREAPSLAAQVRTGKLPPLHKRLPTTPVILEPADSEGKFGGTWNTCITAQDAASVFEHIGYDQLTRWDPVHLGKVLPNLLRSWDVSADGLTYTCKLVEGARWSDGELFTADDILFAYQDVLQNQELHPTFPEWLESDDRPGTIKKVDRYTFTLTYTKPNALLPENLAMPDGNILCSLPKHYLKKFHKKYNPHAPDLATQQGFDDWTQLFFGKGGGGPIDLGAWQNPGLPTMLPWQVREPLQSANRLVVERNPYYWKTDPHGRQLPYIDRVVIRIVDAEVAVLQSAHGQYSLPTYDALDPAQKPVLARARQSAGFHFITLVPGYTNENVIALNFTAKNPNLRRVFQNKDFRIGLSHAINRKELIEAIYQRQGEPWQTAPRPESPYFDEQMAKQYTEYDVDKANHYLDRAGYTERDSNGFRIGPGGRRISFTTEVPIGYGATRVPATEMVRDYWKAVGVDMRIRSEDVSLFFQRTEANLHDAVAYHGEYGLRLGIMEPKWYFPLYYQSFFATQWGVWYDSRHESGERPPAPARRQMDLYDRVKTTVDPAERAELFKEILRIAREEFYVIGTVLPAYAYSIVKDNFFNVPKKYPVAWLWCVPGLVRPEQFYTEGS